MKYFLPNQNFGYLQTNRSDRLGSIWSSFNLDFQSKLATMRLSNKLVTNTTSGDDADLGLPVAFEFYYDKWWAICGTRLFKTADNLITSGFTEDDSGYRVGDSTSQFDVTNPSGTTFRYTWDATGTNPGITALTFPIGSTVYISDTDLAAENNGTFTITGSGANYFEVTNASGVAETDKTIGLAGDIAISGGTIGRDFSTAVSDLAVFNDKLWATTGLKLYSKVFDLPNDPWTAIATMGISTIPHKLVYFKKTDRLYYVSSAVSIRSVNTSDTVATSGDYTLNPGKSIGYISSMVATNSSIWIGGFSENISSVLGSNKLQGTISQWDGFSNQVTNEFKIDGAGVMAMCVQDDVPYAVDTEGRVLQYTGYSFKEIARLPINGQLLLKSTEDVGRFIHFNGFTGTKNNTLLVLLNNLNEDANGTINENLPSGIWELDLETRNFTHKYSPTLKSMSSSTVTDFGQNRISQAGALKINTLQSDSVLGRSTLLAGLNYFTDATTVKSGIFIDSPYKPNTDLEGQKRGYFVTTWFESADISSNFKRLWAIFKKFTSNNGKIIFKYRLKEEDPIEATITWTSTTSFTTTTNISAYIGYEAEIIQGTGSGSCNNISNVTELTGTYTVTLDTAVTGVTGTAKARFQKWIKLTPEFTGESFSYGQAEIAQNDIQIQIKGILEWTGDCEFTKMVLESDEFIKS